MRRRHMLDMDIREAELTAMFIRHQGRVLRFKDKRRWWERLTDWISWHLSQCGFRVWR